MNDLKKYVSNRKTNDPSFNEGYEEGHQSFKIGALLEQAREDSGLTQEEIAKHSDTN